MSEINGSEIEITLLEKIRAAFPELKWNEYEYIHQGFDHDVIILDKAIAFRFPRSVQYLDQLPKEIQLLERLRPLVAAAIPRYTFVAPDQSFAGYPTVPGHSLSTDYFATLDPVGKQEVTAQLGGFLWSLHSFDVSNWSQLVGQTDLKLRQQELWREADEYRLRDRLTAHERTRVDTILREVDDLLAEPVPAALIHYDITPRHLLWNASSHQLGVIDFSDMGFGDPAFDFAELFKYGVEFVNRVFAAYQSPASDTDFLRRARIYQRRVGVAVMVTSIVNPEKVSFTKAKAIFDAID